MFLKIKAVSVNQITLIFRSLDPFAVLQAQQERSSHYKSLTFHTLIIPSSLCFSSWPLIFFTITIPLNCLGSKVRLVFLCCFWWFFRNWCFFGPQLWLNVAVHPRAEEMVSRSSAPCGCPGPILDQYSGHITLFSSEKLCAQRKKRF